ncbi:MAG: hypothetical protein LBF34_02450, partial [Puniceicoccales bacterium]|nr:hypothetical protein [Puniceicoccales bacterium]
MAKIMSGLRLDGTNELRQVVCEIIAQDADNEIFKNVKGDLSTPEKRAQFLLKAGGKSTVDLVRNARSILTSRLSKSSDAGEMEAIKSQLSLLQEAPKEAPLAATTVGPKPLNDGEVKKKGDELFKLIGKLGWKSVKESARKRDEIINPIKDILTKLSPEDLKKVLQEQNRDGFTLLTRAASSDDPKALQAIIDAFGE